jgi:hypothetical protein
MNDAPRPEPYDGAQRGGYDVTSPAYIELLTLVRDLAETGGLEGDDDLVDRAQALIADGSGVTYSATIRYDISARTPYEALWFAAHNSPPAAAAISLAVEDLTDHSIGPDSLPPCADCGEETDQPGHLCVQCRIAAAPQAR